METIQVSNDFTATDIENIASIVGIFPEATQLSIAKICAGSISYYGAIKDKGGIKTIDNSHSVFEIGSITKVFTSLLMVKMASEDLFDINHRIDDYLGFKLNGNASITFKQLANHTSGLPRIPPGLFLESVFKNKENPYKDYNEERLVHYLKYNLKKKRRVKYRYSNLGAGILGFILSQIGRKPYEDLLQELIFQPLKMYETSTNRDLLINDLVVGLNKKGHPTSNWDITSLAGAGAIISSVSDLAKFTVANFNRENAEFNLQRKKTFKANPVTNVALGWHMVNFKLAGGNEWHIHDGGTGGYRSVIIMDVKQQNGVVVLSNVSGLYLFKGEKITQLAITIMESMIDV